QLDRKLAAFRFQPWRRPSAATRIPARSGTSAARCSAKPPTRTPQTAGMETERPIMNVNYRAGDLGETAKADLARKLTDVMIRMEGGANTHGGRAFAWVMFNELTPGNWGGGGETR